MSFRSIGPTVLTVIIKQNHYAVTSKLDNFALVVQIVESNGPRTEPCDTPEGTSQANDNYYALEISI